MNELCKLFLHVNNHSKITLENNKTYHVYQDDSFIVDGYFCSNTAKKDENPTGLRFSAIYLKGKKDIVIDGNGAEIIVHGKMTPILLDKCEDIVIRNLSIDYACPTMSEFKVVSGIGSEYILKINDECLFEIEDNILYWHGERDKHGEYYWRDTNSGFKRYIKYFNPKKQQSYDFNRDNLTFERIKLINDNTLSVTLKNKDITLPVGCIFQSRSIVRDQIGALIQRSKNITFESLRVKFMHGLGMVSQFSENISYYNCDFTPGKGRTITSTADFFQFSGCKGDIIINNCKAWGAHDDFVNVHGTHLGIIEADLSANKLLVRFMHPESWGFQAFDKGDAIDFIKWDTLQPYHTLTVTDFRKINDTDIELSLDGTLPDIELEKDVVENATYTPNLYVKNCYFGTTAARGILCTTRGEVIIENNVFENLWGPALLIEDDCNFWFESGYTTNIIFRNNVVSNCEYHETVYGAPVIRYSPKVLRENVDTFVHGKLTVEGNIFKNPTTVKHRFLLQHLRKAVIKNNTFDAEFEIQAFNVGQIISE
ncbi:MAG: right-handed parallel beta-helix repeat-containing protein [Clostridia bacterium]|nr:right-handed parallel beta-helix repeat-containing protein [Clostridia bacterium]